MTDEPVRLCTPKLLTGDQLMHGAAAAIREDPRNASAPGVPLSPQHLALLTTKYWGGFSRTLTVTFLEKSTYRFRQLILQHLNAWYRGGGSIRFAYTSSATGDVRITTTDDGYWSYLGTDIHQIPAGEPTMCLEGFTERTPQSEYARVVRHECGHTLGFPHEHMRKELVALIDPAKAYAYFLRTQGWDRATVDAQVLTTLDDRALMATPPDTTSVMCYQLPGSIMYSGQPIVGGADIEATDQAFNNRVYPRVHRTRTATS